MEHIVWQTSVPPPEVGRRRDSSWRSASAREKICEIADRTRSISGEMEVGAHAPGLPRQCAALRPRRVEGIEAADEDTRLLSLASSYGCSASVAESGSHPINICHGLRAEDGERSVHAGRSKHRSLAAVQRPRSCWSWRPVAPSCSSPGKNHDFLWVSVGTTGGSPVGGDVVCYAISVSAHLRCTASLVSHREVDS